MEEGLYRADNPDIEKIKRLWKAREDKFKDEEGLIKKLKDFVDKNSDSCAELSQLQKFFKKEKIIPEKIYLLGTQGSNEKRGSDFICEILKEKIPEVIWEFKNREREIIIEIEISDPYQGDKAFLESMNEIVGKVWNIFKEHTDKCIYLFVAGGYKGFIPILSVIATLHKEVYIVYTHEESDKIFIIPPLPFTINFRVMDEYRSILKLSPIDKDLYENLEKGSFPAISLFYSPDKGYKQTSLGEWFKKIIEEGRFSFGENLRFKIKNKDFREKIEEKLKYYEHLWIGDQIPETVEHSRFHSLRLCEYTNLLLDFYPELLEDLKDEGLFILYVAIWLHDIGHGAVKFSANKSGIFGKILKNDKLFSQIPRNVGLYPEKVRDYHNYLSVDMLENEFKFLLPEVSDALIDVIKLCIIYHRRKTPFLRESKREDSKFIYSLEEVVEKNYPSIKEELLLSAALLSFIDGLDVQSDRVVGEEYKEMRETRDKYEIDYHLGILESASDKFKEVNQKLKEMKECWENCKNVNTIETMERLSQITDENAFELIKYHARRACFIMEQKFHFKKHSIIDTVVLSREKDNTLKITFILQKDDEEMVKMVCKDIKGEYDRSKKLEKFFKIKFSKYIDGEEKVICVKKEEEQCNM